jgi:hypothetical protein
MIMIACTLTVGASPSASTENGFAAAVTQNAAGDYTLTFAAAFTAYVYPTPPTPVATTDKLYGWVYSVSLTTLRVRFANEGGTLTDPDSAKIVVLGV